MTRFLIQRVMAFLGRVCGACIVVLLLIELSFCVLGSSEHHVWAADSYGAMSADLAMESGDWWSLVQSRSWNTLRVLLIAYGGALLLGYSWGILSARFRRLRLSLLLGLPLSLFACVPGFWFVVIVAIYSYFEWQRPGFSNEVVVESGPDLMSWWYAAVVALPLLAVAAAWYLRAVSEVIEKEAARPFVRGLYVAGHRDEDIFYANIYRRAKGGLIALVDQALPYIFGGLICLEWAFQYEGVGSLFVDSVKEGYYDGMVLCSLWVAAMIGVVTMVREMAVRIFSVR
tara:strand:+ start:824 stop:1681 length:858 start_codon:yes stop_codon:yes gene_type:complete